MVALPPEFSQPLVLGTSNAGKLAEVAGYAVLLGFRVVGLHDALLRPYGTPPHVAEVAPTYSENAELKAVAYAKWSDRACLADDTGLEIPSLGGLPGLYTARWGLERVVSTLGVARCVPARFVCAMAYADPSGRCVSALGYLEGELREMVVDVGIKRALPFSDYFYPRGGDAPLSTLLQKGYDRSHRFAALNSLVQALV